MPSFQNIFLAVPARDVQVWFEDIESEITVDDVGCGLWRTYRSYEDMEDEVSDTHISLCFTSVMAEEEEKKHLEAVLELAKRAVDTGDCIADAEVVIFSCEGFVGVRIFTVCMAVNTDVDML